MNRQLPLLHIANTFFESEMEASPSCDLSTLLRNHPVFLQLQFLPLLYRNLSDRIAVSDLPMSPYPHLLSIDKLDQPYRIESWGASLLIQQWAEKQGLSYAMPSWEVVKEVNAKTFSFQQGMQLPHATLLTQPHDLFQWLQDVSGPKVLKTCFGVSGRGHLLIEPLYPLSKDKILSFAQREWERGRPLIAEPWVERLLDFSTQWEIAPDRSIHFIGETLCENNSRGKYVSTRVGNAATLFAQHLPFLGEHKQYALPVLTRMGAMGYFGNVGIDAMLYADPASGATRLQPIVEINARKTMGWASLALREKHFPDQPLTLTYAQGNGGMLPSSVLLASGKQICFPRNLTIH